MHLKIFTAIYMYYIIASAWLDLAIFSSSNIYECISTILWKGGGRGLAIFLEGGEWAGASGVLEIAIINFTSLHLFDLLKDVSLVCYFTLTFLVFDCSSPNHFENTIEHYLATNTYH